jgi:hypothetical protein
MFRSFLTGMLAVVTGNVMITVLEKLVYSQKNLDTLHDLLLQGSSRVSIGELYPPEILSQKMFIWAVAAFAAGLVVTLVKAAHKKKIYAGVTLFFILAAAVNLYIVPHPAWLTAAVPALFVMPMYAASQTPNVIMLMRTARYFTNEPLRQDAGENMPAAA